MRLRKGKAGLILREGGGGGGGPTWAKISRAKLSPVSGHGHGINGLDTQTGISRWDS